MAASVRGAGPARRILGAACLLLAAGCGITAAAVPAAGSSADLSPLQSGLDYHSFANVEQFRVTHLQVDLRVDFPNKVMFGAVTLEIKRLDPRATELVLDTRDLDIRDVEENAFDVLGATAKSQTTWVSRPYHLDKADPILGSPLVIELPPSKKTKQVIRISYVTSPTSPGLHWLSDQQTAEHKPLMYTMSEPIGARSWIPLQDTPQVRAPYTAHILTLNDVIAVMSAKNDPKAKHTGAYTFEMPEPVPSYLIALAVGDFRFESLGPRTGVYAHKHELSAAVKEFADAEAMLRAGEKMFGPYRWDRYDIVVLPPSMPVGGVGNPRLSFVSSTLIAGDKSLVSGVARDLAHSWSGNLVTAATWRDLWLNEAFSEYLGSRIVAEVYGERHDAMDRVLGLRELREALSGLDSKDQWLAVDLRNRDPELAYGVVPEQKGRLLLTFLESKFGRERIDAFLKDYFDHFTLKNVTTEQFLSYLETGLLDRFPGIVTREQMRQWISAPGIPAQAVLPVAENFTAVDAARSMWLEGKSPARKLPTHDWTGQQWIYFLDNMPGTLKQPQLAELDQTFKLSQGTNAQVSRSWLMLVIRGAYQPEFPYLEQYLVNVGRSSLVVPLYTELVKTSPGAVAAKRVYALARPGYARSTTQALDAIVDPDADRPADE